MRSVAAVIANPPLPQIASELRADAAFQITRTAERLGFTGYSDVLAEVAMPRGLQVQRMQRDDLGCYQAGLR